MTHLLFKYAERELNPRVYERSPLTLATRQKNYTDERRGGLHDSSDCTTDRDSGTSISDFSGGEGTC